MKRLLVLGGIVIYSVSVVAQANNNVKQHTVDVNLMDISQALLLAAKTKEPTDSLTALLKKISVNELQNQLLNDDQKKAFWINIYNAYTQIILSKNPDQYKKRSSFFGSKQIIIGQRSLSLDNIEHDILRHSKVKWSLGYLNKLFPAHFEKINRVTKVDYRIHFALNCGAKSCPPIAFYKPQQLNKQLDIATKVYLTGESEYKETENKVYVPALMGWFRHDFGGKKKMKILLKELMIVPKDKNPSVTFKKYDWNLYLENYKNE
jgi:Protein of unknown function, DUF547